MTDTLRDGRFVVLAALGEGSQGRTFDGVDKREGKPVAIKRFDVARAKAWKDVELAEREARVLQALHHPKLPAYVDHFEEGGALYLAMEKIEGESIAALRKRGASLGEADVVRFLRDASDVLGYLHTRSPPVIHRDLKPGNVIRRPDGSFAFVDFGAVRDKLRPEGGSTVVGTFGFMAPEQFQGRALPASDVYAIGATALTMLTGREPEELPHVGLGIDVRAALSGNASDRMIDVLAKMLDPNPDTRARVIAPLLAELDARDARKGKRGDDRQWSYDYEKHARKYDRRAEDYEQRAARGDPGRDGWLDGAAEFREAAAQIRSRMAEEMDRHGRRAARRAERAARRAERRAERWSSRGMQRRGVPFPFSLFLTLAFTAAIIGLTLSTQVVAPLVLRLLSLFVARHALRGAADSVQYGGEQAIQGMRRSLAWTRGEGAPGPQEDAHVRVEEVGETRARVVDEPGPATGAGAEGEEELADVPSSPAAESERQQRQTGRRSE